MNQRNLNSTFVRHFLWYIFRMKFLLLTFVSLVLLAAVKADKGAQDSNLSMVLVKGLQSQLKTCMDQNRELVQRSCQKPGHWGGNGGRGNSLTKKNYTKIYVTYTWNILHIYVSYMYSLCLYMLAICICYIYVELGPTYMWHICKYMGSIWDW